MSEDIPCPTRIRFRDIWLLWGDSSDDGERVQVKYFAYEKTFKERLSLYFIINQESSFRIRLFNVFIKLLSCLLYVVRVCLDHSPQNATCFGCSLHNYTFPAMSMEEERYLYEGEIFYPALFWVERHQVLWLIQVVVAIISLVEQFLITYISYKGSIIQIILRISFLLELFNSTLFVVTIFCFQCRNLFVPVFLNCWLARLSFVEMFKDFHRGPQRNQSALRHRIISLLSFLFCFIFTSTCGLQHIQRTGRKQMDLFQSLYCVIVTFSTVGYGEFYPDVWLSQLFMIGMICAAFFILPIQVEHLASAWIERQKSGGSYSKHRARLEKHVVLTTTCLQAETIMDFLNEFYAHPLLQDHFVILLSPVEMDATLRMILSSPIWEQRVIYIQGSALRDSDLERARTIDAEACFVLGNRTYTNKNAADEHTILRSWSIKDYAPHCPQYVQIFRPENKMHVKHAEHVVCEDEFKFSLMANTCLCPGLASFLTIILHTSRGEEGQNSTEEWHRLYGKHSGNEIYHIKLAKSTFFGEYEGKSFTYASFHAHRKYGVGLLAVQREEQGSTIMLNPGPRHIMKATDTCYYMSITKEEHSTFIHTKELELRKSGRSEFWTQLLHIVKCGCCRKRSDRNYVKQIAKDVVIELQHPVDLSVPDIDINSAVSRKPSIAPVPESFPSVNSELSSAESWQNATGNGNDGEVITESSDSDNNENCIEDDDCKYLAGFPPVTPYVGTSAILCHLLKDKKPICCLHLAEKCEHCSHQTAKEYNWKQRAIILAADFASNGIYQFIVPLRAHFRKLHKLHPIVLLLVKKPDVAFLDAISYFPLVYWMKGSIDSLDDLLRAGINLSDHVVVVNKENEDSMADFNLADCNTIVSVQSIFRLFPCVRIITELSQSTNMRFMQFSAKDVYALHQSKIEKRERTRGSNMAYIFRLPFAEGNVFSASMLDTLLYQAFVKNYLIQLVRLLLGIDQAVGSGYLTCIQVTEHNIWIRTYGRLYQKLCSTNGDIPIGIFRTQPMDHAAITAKVSIRMQSDAESMDQSQFSGSYLVSERHEIGNLVKCRMEALGLPIEDYRYHSSETRGSVSYVIINPNYDLKLEMGDLVYIVRPPRSRKGLNPTPSIRFRYGLKSRPRRHGRFLSLALAESSKLQQHSAAAPVRQQDCTSPIIDRGVHGVKLPQVTFTASSPTISREERRPMLSCTSDDDS